MRIRGGGSERKSRPCLLKLHDYCHVYELVKGVDDVPEWGSREWVKTYCAMCIKAIYARAHLEKAESMKVVNTL